jgi:hypothetical protein
MYPFKMHVVSQYGYRGSYHGTIWIRVAFEPISHDRTAVTFHLTDDPNVSGEMQKTDDRFHGIAIGEWGTTCGKRASISHFSWQIVIVHASPDNARDLLVADRLSATLRVYELAQGGCGAAGVTFQGTASGS